jgi:V/A-type H+-transporting ATPase subunit C
MVGFGLAPVAAYVAAIENEIVAARMILTGKLAGVKTETLRSRLRESY